MCVRRARPGSATQELRGLGLANLVGAAFNCYTTTGSFSRSAVMNDVGAKTQLAGVTSGARARAASPPSLLHPLRAPSPCRMHLLSLPPPHWRNVLTHPASTPKHLP